MKSQFVHEFEKLKYQTLKKNKFAALIDVDEVLNDRKESNTAHTLKELSPGSAAIKHPKSDNVLKSEYSQLLNSQTKQPP